MRHYTEMKMMYLRHHTETYLTYIRHHAETTAACARNHTDSLNNDYVCDANTNKLEKAYT